MLRKPLAVVGSAVWLCLSSSQVLAQANGPVTPTVPQQTDTTETTPAPVPPVAVPAPSAVAAPTPTPAPHDAPPAPPAPVDSGLVARAAAAVTEAVRIYGTVRPLVSFSGSAVESFSNPNASAVTAAANPVIANMPNESRLSFQVAQTRFGLWLNEKGNVRGHLEFDFIDFAKSSPTVQSLIRLRIATVEWNPLERLTIAAGQDWDLHAPINAHGLNMVGTHFLSGNTGFMRQQVKALYKLGDHAELAGAVGLQGINATAKDGPNELARIPTFAVRATGLLGAYGKVGVSGIVTRLRFTPGNDERHALAGGVALFGELTPYATLAIRFEGYLGRNLANLGTLALSQGNRQDDIDELGGFVSVRQSFLEQHAVYGSFGHAAVLNGNDVIPSYSYAAGAAGSVPVLGSATLAGTGPGIRWNQAARIGYDYKPVKALALAVEGFWYDTRHVLAELDEGRAGRGTRHALGADVGMLYTF